LNWGYEVSVAHGSESLCIQSKGDTFGVKEEGVRNTIERSDAYRLVASILFCEAAGVVGSLFTISAITTWYATLQKPWFTPPSWLFAPVWLSLYFLMGLALYLLWKRKEKTGPGLTAFGIQLALNVLWSAVFFGAHLLFFGFVVIVALWLTIAATMALSYKVSRSVVALLAPYILWVTIASALNYYVWILNP
jgi:benzodiazapine receptor